MSVNTLSQIMLGTLLTYPNALQYVQIEEVTEDKLLEIKIQNNLTWTAHIADLSKR